MKKKKHFLRFLYTFVIILFFFVLDGIAFFISDEQPEQHDINDETKKQELRNIVKRKIKKSIKNALPRHVKPNKRFKRFTKNL